MEQLSNHSAPFELQKFWPIDFMHLTVSERPAHFITDAPITRLLMAAVR